MVELMQNPTNSEENVEYEYVELEEGQELPEGYEYEYVDEMGNQISDPSEIDVLNNSSNDVFVDDDLASSDDIKASIHQAQHIESDYEEKSEAPFPSFLQETENSDVENNFVDISQTDVLQENQNINFVNEDNDDFSFFEENKPNEEFLEAKVDNEDVQVLDNSSKSLGFFDSVNPSSNVNVADIENDVVEEQSFAFNEKDDLDFENNVSLDELLDEPIQSDVKENEEPHSEELISDVIDDGNVYQVEEEILPTGTTETVSDVEDVSFEDVTTTSHYEEPENVFEEDNVKQSIEAQSVSDTKENYNDETYNTVEYEEQIEAKDIKENVSSLENSIMDVSENIYEEPVEKKSELVLPIQNFAQNDEKNISPNLEYPEIKNLEKNEYEESLLHAKIISKNMGIQNFCGTENLDVLIVDEIDFEHQELSQWNLILFSQEVSPLSQKVSLIEKVNPQLNYFASLVQNGVKKVDFFNEDKLKILNTSDTCVAVNGNFICGDFTKEDAVFFSNFVVVSLQNFAGKVITMPKLYSGILAGPNGSLLFFANVAKIILPHADMEEVDAEKLQYKISKWYSGTFHDKYFEFDSRSNSEEFIGNDDIHAIHVNVGTSSYGWNVSFDNGINMNLRDLREYQTRFGKLPSNSGVLSYGQKTLTFKNVDRIVVYEEAQYYFYS